MPESKPASFTTPRYWPLHIAIGWLGLMARLPYPAVLWFGRRFGSLMYWLMAGRREITLTNLKLCFPALTEDQIKTLAKQNFRSYGAGVMEMTTAWHHSPAQLSPHLSLTGLEHLEQARAAGKGVILLSFHMTNLEISGCVLSTKAPLTAMYRPNNNPLMDQFIDQGRKNKLPTIDRDNIRGVVRKLRKGETVWYGVDQDYGPEHSVFVPFFGIPTATITAVTRLVSMTGAAVVPFLHWRGESGRELVLELLPPLTPMGNDETADASKINALLEGFLAKQPRDYIWSHRRFKTRPPGVASVYPRRAKKRRPMSARRFDALLKKHRVIEQEKGLIKVLLANDNEIIKLFHRRKKLSRDWLFPYAKRFVKNSHKLAELGVESVQVTDLRHCPARQCHVVRYPLIAGRTAREAMTEAPDEILPKLAAFCAELHARGIYFRAGHCGNILRTEEGGFALIDITDCFFHKPPLRLEKRGKNLRHILSYHQDREFFDASRRKLFMDAYVEHANLDDATQQFRRDVESMIAERMNAKRSP